jgi:hypothetical protein
VKTTFTLLLALALLAGAFAGGWWTARRQGAAALSVARDTITSQQRLLEAQGARAVAFAGEVDGLADSVHQLLGRIRNAATPRPAADGVAGAPDTSPRGPESSIDSGPPIVPTYPQLVAAALEACDTLASRCQALGDSVRALTDSIAATDRRFTGILDSLAGTAPVPGIRVDLGGFKTGAAVGAGGTAVLVALLYLLFH